MPVKMRVVALYALLNLLCLCYGSTPDNNQDFPTNSFTVEGDIFLNQKQLAAYHISTSDLPRPQRAVTLLEGEKWPYGIVPYELAPDLNSGARNAIMAAISQYTTDTCIQLKRREPLDVNYIYFYPGTGCMSFVGRQGGKQNISIDSMCQHKGVVMHEIFHALGRWHEHSRPDRNNYIRVNYNNIISGKTSNFRTISSSSATTQNIGYDYDSLMHYDAYAFSSNTKPTLQPLNESIPLSRIGQRDTFSELDIRHINALYCDGSTNEWSSWTPWSDCSVTCGEGQKQRTRTCLGEGECPGSHISFITCNHGNCPVVPSWGPWSMWSGCSRTCGGGQRTRVRMCEDDDGCDGEKQEFQECNSQECPEVWGPWAEWSMCTKTCDGGFSTRTRVCVKADGSEAVQSKCNGSDKEHRDCNVHTCPDPPLVSNSIVCPEQAICSSAAHLQNLFLLFLNVFVCWLCTHR